MALTAVIDNITQSGDSINVFVSMSDGIPFSATFEEKVDAADIRSRIKEEMRRRQNKESDLAKLKAKLVGEIIS